LIAGNLSAASGVLASIRQSGLLFFSGGVHEISSSDEMIPEQRYQC
jgi:hypothetical protein